MRKRRPFWCSPSTRHQGYHSATDSPGDLAWHGNPDGPQRRRARQDGEGRARATSPSSPPDAPSPSPAPETAIQSEPERPRWRARLWTSLAVIGLLALHYALAAQSLLLENPTVDEVVHMPAGISYWQKGTFKLYHHNPPLFKLVAALPVVMARPETEPLYGMKSWRSKDPSAITFSQEFAIINADRYFELFQLARLMMPLFSIVGGLVVFAWSRRLYGPGRAVEPGALGVLSQHPGPCPAGHVGCLLDRDGGRGDLCLLAISCRGRPGAGRSRRASRWASPS